MKTTRNVHKLNFTKQPSETALQSVITTLAIINCPYIKEWHQIIKDRKACVK